MLERIGNLLIIMLQWFENNWLRILIVIMILIMGNIFIMAIRYSFSIEIPG